MPKLDENLLIYQTILQEMAKKVRSMHTLALEILETGDKEKALTIIKFDEFVNNYEEEINDKAQMMLSLLSPVATDLRIIIAGIKTANDLERIADYAKNVARFVIKQGSLDPRIVKKAQTIGELFLTMFDHTMEAYEKRDINSAMVIPDEDVQINSLFDDLNNQLQTIVDSKESIPDIIAVTMLLRNFERAGDHTKNICEHLIFLVKDQYIDLD